MYTDRRYGLRTMAGVTVVAVLTLSGCGDDGDGQADPVPAGESEESVESDETVENGESTDETSESADATDATVESSNGDVQDLVPPGVVSESDLGTSTLYRSEASFDEVVAYYDSALGDATFVTPDESAAAWMKEFGGALTSVNVSAEDEGLLNVLVATIG